jgi:hypothetical protein
MIAGFARRLVNGRSMCPVCYQPIDPGDNVHRDVDNADVHFDCFDLWPWEPTVRPAPPAG